VAQLSTLGSNTIMKIRHLVLLVSVGVFFTVNFVSAQTWTKQSNSPASYWNCIASSADGSKLIAASFNGPIYTSPDSGITWVESSNAPGSEWIAAVSSADGVKLAALNTGNSVLYDNTLLYTSTDSGTTWTSINTTSVALNCMALSADGTTLIAGDWNDFGVPSLIYSSTNFGITWVTNSAPSEYWTSIASSADGTKFVAGCVNPNDTGAVFLSPDSGMTWNETDLPFANWQSVASSADGSKLVAAASGGLVYTSTNSGATWMTNSMPVTFWISVTVSADGSRFVAANTYGSLNNAGIIYASTDYGLSWMSNDVPSNVSWQAIASAADGNRLAVATFNNSIYTFYSRPQPTLNLKPLPPNLIISWVVPATNLVLQQSADLISWANMTNKPMLNLTNLQNQISLSPANGIGFYRLLTP
jgi:photosystem II stability/assembly factor-like uncharacterized protein